MFMPPPRYAAGATDPFMLSLQRLKLERLGSTHGSRPRLCPDAPRPFQLVLGEDNSTARVWGRFLHFLRPQIILLENEGWGYS